MNYRLISHFRPVLMDYLLKQRIVENAKEKIKDIVDDDKVIKPPVTLKDYLYSVMEIE